VVSSNHVSTPCMFLPSTDTSSSSRWSLPVMFPHHACYTPHLSDPHTFHRSNKVSCKLKITQPFIMRVSLACCFFLYFKYFLRHYFSHTASLCSVFNVRHQHVCINPRCIIEPLLTSKKTVGRNKNEHRYCQIIHLLRMGNIFEDI
jgi:hypothetical protein